MDFIQKKTKKITKKVTKNLVLSQYLVFGRSNGKDKEFEISEFREISKFFIILKAIFWI